MQPDPRPDLAPLVHVRCAPPSPALVALRRAVRAETDRAKIDALCDAYRQAHTLSVVPSGAPAPLPS